MASRQFEDEMRRLVAARQDAQVREMFFGTTATNPVPQEPLTLDKIMRLAADMRAKLGPTPMFLSSKLFPEDKALSLESATTKYTCAGPGFWSQFQHEIMRNVGAYKPPALNGPMFRPMCGIPILEIDLIGDETPERAEYLRGVWRELIETVTVAMTPLPDWLRSAPKFTQHG